MAGRPKKGIEKRVAYNGKLEPYKITVLGGTKECNALAYEYLTKRYNERKQRRYSDNYSFINYLFDLWIASLLVDLM